MGSYTNNGSTTTPIERVLDKLAPPDKGKPRKKSGEGYKVLCPVPEHDDKNPSLSVSEGDDGRVLIRCFADCETEDVLQAAGLTWNDLFDAESAVSGSANGHQRSSAPKETVYEIRDVDDNLIAHKHRIDNPDDTKDFWLALPDGGKLSEAGIRPAQLPLYGAELLPKGPRNTPVVLVEGEKATDALRRGGLARRRADTPSRTSGGPLVALGTVTGASKEPDEASLEILRDRRVILWADNDDAGRDHMRRIAQKLDDVAASVQWYVWAYAPPGGDAADMVGKDETTEDELLHNLLRAPLAGEFMRQVTSQAQVSPSPSLKDSDTSDTYMTTLEYPEIHVVDVAKSQRPQGSQPFLVADVMPENYPTVFFGDSGSVKSTLAGNLAQCVARGIPWMGHETKQTSVLTLDFELDTDTHNRRAHDTAKGMGQTSPPEGTFYIECAGLPAKAVFTQALDFCKERGVGLVIVDSLGVALEGDAEAARDVIGWMRTYVDRFRAAGITTLIIDHQGKLQAGERYQSKTQFGSAYKKHLARSVFQIEKRESTDEGRRITFRHTKTNFGRELDPFGIKVTWEPEKITVEPDELTQADLAQEGTVPVAKRILTELKDGPKYPDELADALGVDVRTVKNRLSDLRKSGKVEDTGERRGQSRQVSLVSLTYSDGDGDTCQEPLSFDTTPGEVTDLDELKRRRRETWQREPFFPELDEAE